MTSVERPRSPAQTEGFAETDAPRLAQANDAALPPLPRRIAALPKDEHGLPRPWFAPDGHGFGSAPRAGAAVQAGKASRCWICGEALGRNVVFLLSAQQALTRISVEPGCHLECVGWVAAAEPGLHRAAPAEPPVTVLWTTRSWRMLPKGRGFLWELGDPAAVAWYRAGNPATLEQASAAVAAASRELQPRAEAEGERAMHELLRAVQAVLGHLPLADPTPEGA